MVLAEIQWVLFYIILPITILFVLAVVGVIGTCWMHNVDFARKKRNPLLFIYRYHPNFFTFQTTVESVQSRLNDKKVLPFIAEQLKMSVNEITAVPATIIYDEFKNLTMTENFRMAVGVLITSDSLRFKSSIGRVNTKTLQKKLIGGGGGNKSSKMKAEDLNMFRVRMIPASEYQITFYPYTFGMLSYVLGAIRVVGDAAKKAVMKAPVIQVLDRSEYFGDESGQITYLFPQNNLRSFAVDMDMLRPEESKAVKQQRTQQRRRG